MPWTLTEVAQVQVIIKSVRILTKRNNSQLYIHNPQSNSIHITRNKCHHIKSDTKMALRNTNPWFLQHPFKVYFTTRWTMYFAAYSNFPANECKILATMQDFLIICSFTITFKVLFQKRFSIKSHLPIAPSAITINQPIWLKRNLSILKGGAGAYPTCTHFSFIFMFYCRF